MTELVNPCNMLLLRCIFALIIISLGHETEAEGYREKKKNPDPN